MIEFLSLCVCSACLSWVCCLITGGLCMVPAVVRFRNKLAGNHVQKDIHWISNMPECKGSRYGTNGFVDCCPISRVCPADQRLSRKKTARISRHRSQESIKVADSNKDKQNGTTATRTNNRGIFASKNKSHEKTQPKRWAICFDLGKPRRNSSEHCSSLEVSGNVEPEPRRSIFSCKKSKKKSPEKPGDILKDSKTYCAYFKSCSCTRVAETQKKWRCKRRRKSEKSSEKCEPEPTQSSKPTDRSRHRSKHSRKFSFSKSRTSSPKADSPDRWTKGTCCRCKPLPSKNTTIAFDQRLAVKTCGCCKRKRFITGCAGNKNVTIDESVRV